jgi:hypothetical protein
LPQDAQVLGHGGLAHTQRLHELADGALVRAQELHDLSPVGLGEDLEGGHHSDHDYAATGI